MKQLGLSFFSDIYLTIIALGLFLAVFIGITIRVYSKERRQLYKDLSELPLQEQSHERQ